jgi:aerotaxis receptor
MLRTGQQAVSCQTRLHRFANLEPHMRSNLPVVDQEYPFPEGESLVSTTDLKGRILYCNPAFIQVSGYPREALLGQPHNMIRHPDMPEEAFRDMWETIAAGHPWLGLVKNRRADGRYYWVCANVTPLIEGGKPTGYMSVRTKPDEAEKQAAEQLYATMRAEKQAGQLIHMLKSGRLMRNTWQGRFAQYAHLDLAGELALSAALMMLVAMAASVSLSGGWSQVHITSMTALGVLLVIGTFIARLVFQRLAVAPIKTLLVAANRMAAGDLTIAITSKRSDTIGQFTRALNQLKVNLFAIVRDARTEVEQMQVATQEIASGNQDLSSRTEAQAGSLEQTAASMEQITGTVRHNADTARQAADLAQQTTAITQRSGAAVDDLTTTMHTIEESSQRINDIIQVIDSIAFQTNILALNAAVEAARAGDQGRGFAVVAAEVRALAQRTASAAREVKTLIVDSADKVQAGCALTGSVQSTMQEALSAVGKVGSLVEAISHGINEQLTGISQINSAVSHLDGITQQNAAAVEQIAAASMSLAGRAKVVSDAVQVFRLDEHAPVQPANAVTLRRQNKAPHQTPARLTHKS